MNKSWPIPRTHYNALLLERDTLIDHFNVAEDEIERLRERDEWLRKQLDGCIDHVLSSSLSGLTAARVLVADLRDARKALEPRDIEEDNE